MLKNIIGAVGAILLLVWLTQVARTTSVLIGVGFPILGLLLAMVWFVWTAQERIASRAQPQMLGLQELELLKKALRDKKARDAAAAQGSDTAPPAAG